jgi:ankyrin repeat protein
MQLVNKHYTKTFNSYYAISHECSPDIIQYYAKLGANINNLNMNKKTCLHLALRNEHFLLIEKLIQCGANINALDNLDRTPLHHYIHHTPHFFEKITFMQFLIKKYGANLNTLDKTGQSPLTTSIAKLYFNTVYSNKNYIETIKFLILEGNININANAYMQGDTLLHLIPRLGPKSGYHMNPHITELISFLIDHCDANINALNSLGETPLISWIKNKAPNDLIFHLITLGAQIHKRDNSGRSAFDEAILEKNKPVANYLYTQENKYEKTFTEQPMPILNAFSNFCQDLQSITNEIEVENQDKKEGPTTSEKNHHHKPL